MYKQNGNHSGSTALTKALIDFVQVLLEADRLAKANPYIPDQVTVGCHVSLFTNVYALK